MNRLAESIAHHLDEIMGEMGLSSLPWRKMLGPARETDQGDLALPCFPFAKVAGKSPDDIAKALASSLENRMSENTELSSMVGSVSSSGGYLNIRAGTSWMAEPLTELNGDYISIFRGAKASQDVLIEHTSANPNGPFHVGRARNAILGDTLVRLNRLSGNNVRAEYYVDDMGKQVGILAWAIENLSPEQVSELLESDGRDDGVSVWSEKSDHELVRWYQAANIMKNNDASVDQEVGDLVRRSEEGDSEVLEKFKSAYQPVLDGMLETLSRLGISYDTFTPESQFVIDGSVSEVMNRLAETEMHGVAENGAHYLELEGKGISGKSTKFFYQRGDGSSLYATRDIAYHEWKWTQCDRLVNVLGEDHKLQSKQVSIALESVGSKTPEVVFYSFIKLPDGKMSTRRGNVVYMDDLLEVAKELALDAVKEIRSDELEIDEMMKISEAVGTSAVRFNIIKVAPEKGFIFRWDDALSFEAGSAPFIMYSHARACSIVRKVESLGIEVDSIVNSYEHKAEDFANSPKGLVELLRVIENFSGVLDKSVEESRPHLFAKHLLSLANAYNGFYRDCHVISEGDVNQMHLVISEISRNLLRIGCEGLGIIPLEMM